MTTILITPQTQKLLEEHMRTGRFTSPDDVVRVALQTLVQVQGEDYDDLDLETRAAIEESEAQCQRGEARPWEEVRNEVRSRFIDRKTT